MTADVIARTIKEYFAAFRAMDEKRWINTFAADAVSYDPVGTPAIEGHEKLAEFFQTIIAAFKEVGLTENDVFIADTAAAVRWTGRGTSKAGKDVKFAGIDVFEFNEAGKIQTLRADWNPAEMVAQL